MVRLLCVYIDLIIFFKYFRFRGVLQSRLMMKKESEIAKLDRLLIKYKCKPLDVFVEA